MSCLGSSCLGSSFLAREARLVAVTRALRDVATADLDIVDLDLAAAREAAYRGAGVAPVTAAEDAEAVRRQRIYWRGRKPVAAEPVPA